MTPQPLSYGTARSPARTARPAAEALRPPGRSAIDRVPARSSVPTPHGRAPARAPARHVVVAVLASLHALAIVGLMNTSRLREAAAEARPVFLATLAAPVPVLPSRSLPPPPAPAVPAPLPFTLPPMAPEPTPAPSPQVAQAVDAPSPAPPVPAADPVPAPAPLALPRTIPSAGVQFLVPPAPVYSRVSAKMRESGKALVRVFIDEAGMPRNVQLAVSSGFSRLDESALAAVRAARFKPYLDNGVAIAGWASVPIEFELPT